MQIPCNQSRRSGLDRRMVPEEHRHPVRIAPLPWLYQKYAGHDNNRDWFMMNLEETRNVARLLFQRVVSSDRVQPAPGAAVSRAHFRSALRRAAESEYSGGRDGGHQSDRLGDEGALRAGEQAGHSLLLRIRRVVEWRLAIGARVPQHARHPDRDGAACLRHAARSTSLTNFPTFGNGMPTREPTDFL